MNKKTIQTIIILIITLAVYIPLQLSLLSQRGNSHFGGEMLVMFIPFILWVTYSNIKLGKEVKKDCELSDEALMDNYIGLEE